MYNIKLFLSKNCLEDTSPFCRANSGDVCPGFQSSCLLGFSPAHNGFLSSTSGATPADLLTASMATDHIPTCYICSRGRMPGLDWETSRTVNLSVVGNASITCEQTLSVMWEFCAWKSCGKVNIYTHWELRAENPQKRNKLVFCEKNYNQ